ncbi:unnamed protein product, partial [Prorocentrum cordatum]
MMAAGAPLAVAPHLLLVHLPIVERRDVRRGKPLISLYSACPRSSSRCRGACRSRRRRWMRSQRAARQGQRVRALLPALLAKLEGRPPSWLEVLRRNVALHANAEGVDVSTACASVLRREQRGLRLEARFGVTQRGLRA